jgi:hypothetical protein
MLPITDESVGTSKYLTFVLSPKWISLEVINIKKTRRNNSAPNHNKYGINTGLTNYGIPALHPPEGNRRTHIRRSKDHTLTTQRKRYECFFLQRQRMVRTPRYHHDQRSQPMCSYLPKTRDWRLQLRQG